MPDAHGVKRDPRRRVLAWVETEPIAAGIWDSLFEALAETAIDFGVCVGGHIVDAAEESWDPAPGARPEQWRPRTYPLLTLRVAAAADPPMRVRLDGGSVAQVVAHLGELETENAALRAKVSLLEQHIENAERAIHRLTGADADRVAALEARAAVAEDQLFRVLSAFFPGVTREQVDGTAVSNAIYEIATWRQIATAHPPVV